MIIIAELKDDKGQTVGIISAPPKEFKTGSRGFFGMGKMEIDGKRYQIQVQIVEIGSKQSSPSD
jgi:hypothetical protein